MCGESREMHLMKANWYFATLITTKCLVSTSAFCTNNNPLSLERQGVPLIISKLSLFLHSSYVILQFYMERPSCRHNKNSFFSEEGKKRTYTPFCNSRTSVSEKWPVLWDCWNSEFFEWKTAQWPEGRGGSDMHPVLMSKKMARLPQKMENI